MVDVLMCKVSLIRGVFSLSYFLSVLLQGHLQIPPGLLHTLRNVSAICLAKTYPSCYSRTYDLKYFGLTIGSRLWRWRKLMPRRSVARYYDVLMSCWNLWANLSRR